MPSPLAKRSPNCATFLSYTVLTSRGLLLREFRSWASSLLNLIAACVDVDFLLCRSFMRLRTSKPLWKASTKEETTAFTSKPDMIKTTVFQERD